MNDPADEDIADLEESIKRQKDYHGRYCMDWFVNYLEQRLRLLKKQREYRVTAST